MKNILNDIFYDKESPLMRIVIKNLPLKITEKEIKEIFAEYGKITDIFLCKKDSKINRGVCFIGYSDEESSLKAIKFRNKSYIKNKKLNVSLVKQKSSFLKNEFLKITNREEFIEEDEIEVKSKILYIKNLPKITKENDLREFFSECEIEKIKLSLEDKPFAIVHFKDYKSSKIAFQTKKIFLGCRLNISFYNEQIQQKEYYRKLFFDFDSVVENICNEEKITRAELLDLKDKDLGAKISLIETHLVEQTKKFLENNGIFLDNLTGRLNKKILIVRNVNLLSMNFRNCRVKISPSKTLAILEFDKLDDAKKIFEELHCKRVKDKAIYVDYLPISHSEEKEIKSSNKIIIKNVPFQATKSELIKIFSSQVKVKEIRLPSKRDGSHRGFAFLTLNSPEDAVNVIKYFGFSTHLYGRRLVLESAKE